MSSEAGKSSSGGTTVSDPSARKRKQIGPHKQGPTEVLLCPACQSVDVGAPQPSFQLHCGNDCTVCARCFAEIVADGHFKHALDCPLCDGQFTQHTLRYTRTRPSRHGKASEFAESYTSTPISPDQRRDPVRNHESMASHDGGDNFVGITVTTCYENKVKAVSNLFPVDGDCNEWSAEQLQEIERLFQIFHSLLITNDRQRGDKDFHPTAENPTLQAWKTLARDDYSPLHRMIYSLGYGEPLGDCPVVSDESKPNWERICGTTFAATDMLRHLRSDKMGFVKSTMGLLLKSYAVDVAVYRCLNAIGVCCAYEVAQRHQHRQFAQKLRVGIEEETDRHEHGALAFDNCGNRRGGSNPTYVQVTLLFWLFTKFLDLITLRIYRDPKNPDQEPVSRDNGKTWAEERTKPEVTYETVVAPDDEALDGMAGCILPTLDNLLEMASNEKLITHEEAETRLENNMYTYIETPPDLFGKTLPDGVETIVEDVDDESGGDGESQVQTHFSANEAIPDVAIADDLANQRCCRTIADYVQEVTKKILAKAPTPGRENIRPIMEDVPPILACDGSPAKQLLQMSIRSPADHVFLVINGGFHVLLTAFRTLGTLFGFSHLRAFFGCWRKTKGQLDYVLQDPGDPNQISEEMTMFVLGLSTDAIHGLKATKRAEDPNGPVQLSAIDVLDHMNARAKKYPLVFSVLNSLPMAAMIFLLQKSEENADMKAYIWALKLLASPFCAGHKTGYVFLVARFFVFWFCASTAQAVLYAHILFRKTKNGFNTFCDRFVENCVKYTRMFIGKKVQGSESNHLTSVQEASVLLADRLEARETMKKEKGTRGGADDTEQGRKRLQLDKVFHEAMLYSRDLNLFGPGAPRYVPSKPYVLRKAMNQSEWIESSEDVSELKDPTGTNRVCPDILFYCSTGSSRMRDYFTTNEIEGPLNVAERSETADGVSLTLVQADASKVAAAEKDQIERWVSVDPSFMGKYRLIKKDELKSEFDFLNQQLTDEERVTAATNEKGNVTKELYITAVIQARMKLIAKDPEWASKRRASKREEAGASTVDDDYETRCDSELKMKVYTYEGTETRKEYENRKHTIFRSDPPAAMSPDSTATPPAEESQVSTGSIRSTPSTLNLGTAALRRQLRQFQ